jgi:Family of unknown function (DUF6064)
MSEWWSYGLSDFLLFSPRTYYRLFELYNRAVWPAHIVGIGLGVAVLLLLRRTTPAHSRLLAANLALVWLWIAWAFHYERYATINWAATYFGVAFALEGLAFLWLSASPGRLDFEPRLDAAGSTGLILYLFALAVHPILVVFAGRSLRGSEIFAIAPDPTAIGTLGLLLLSRSPSRHLLMLIPFLWCVLTSVTLYAMGSSQAWAVAAAAAAALVAAIFSALGRSVR